MNALLLSAGYGKRLGQLTKNTPKCLLQIKNTNLLEHWIDKLKKAKVNKILINTHFKHELIKKFIIKKKAQKFVKLVHEKRILGTARTLFNNKFFFKDDFLLIHGDNYCEEDIEKLVQAHKKRPKECLITMLTFKTSMPEKCGVIKTDHKKRVIKIYEKKNFSLSKTRIANAAVFMISKRFLINYKPQKKEIDFCKDIIPKNLKKIYTFHTRKFFEDIGSSKGYKKIIKFVK